LCFTLQYAKRTLKIGPNAENVDLITVIQIDKASVERKKGLEERRKKKKNEKKREKFFGETFMNISQI
jgi:hypothetical protein